MDIETKYTIAKSWIAEIIAGSYVNGDPRFKDENYKDAINMVMNDFNMKLKYEKPKPKPKMPNKLKKWITQNYKDCEDGKLDVVQKKLFLDLVEDNLENKDFHDAFKEHLKNK